MAAQAVTIPLDMSSLFMFALTTMVGDMVKVLAWYDNEMGYSTRLYELARFVAEKGL